jgi:hypothetical protein
MGDTPDDYRRMWIEDRFTLVTAQAQRLKRHWQKPVTRRFRICPECLQSTGVHLAFWDLPLVFACPAHKCMLATKCQCGKPIAWASVGPNWTCNCGKTLASLPAQPAPRSLANLAMAIAASSNLHVPGIDRDATEKFRLAADLRSTYEVLAWQRELVRKLRSTPGSRGNTDEPELWCLGPTFDQWPIGLTRLLMHFMKHWHRQDRDKLLVHLQEDSRTMQLLSFLEAATASATLPLTLRRAISKILMGLRFAPTASNQWIFNPALGTTQREGKKHALQQWWRKLSQWMEVEAGKSYRSPDLNRSLTDIDERICVMLLNGLIAAAEQGTSAEEFRRFAAAWPPIQGGTDNLSPSTFLEMIGRQLFEISRGHRDYLCELTLNATGFTHARR